MWPDLPAETWAFVGVVITAVAAYVREKMKAESSPYDSMAKRLKEVEERAAQVPELVAYITLISTWAETAALWMAEVEASWHEEMGEHYFPPAPLPPPRLERRHLDVGPPFPWPERRHPNGDRDRRKS